mgnify:CR=1 FL=1
MALNVTLLAVVIVLLPMVYLFLASPAFLLVKLEIPQVAQLLRTMFFGYFAALVVAGLLAASLDAFDDHRAKALVIFSMTAFAVALRHWFLARMDPLVQDIQAGVADAAPRLRRLHWVGMATNAAQLGAFIVFIPHMISA